MKASDITIEDGMTIDGAGKFTITGGLSITKGEDITIKNVTLDGEGTKDILLSLGNAGDVVIENVIFTNFTKAGIYAEAFTSLNVTKSTFDSSNTVNIGDNDYTGNPEEDLILRSAAGIDLNLGNGGKTIDVSDITISGNTFKNVEVPEEDRPTSTAGAIKIKVKDATNLVNLGTIKIENNEFTDNWQDLVIGTDSPGGGNTQASTGDLQILLLNNKTAHGVLTVQDNSSDDSGLSAGYIGNFKINGALDYSFVIDENYYFVIDDNNVSSIDDSVLEKAMADSDIKGLSYNVDGLSFAISKETLEDEDLGSSLDDFNITPSEETTIEALKKYESTDVAFFTVTGIDLLQNGLTYDISSLGEEYAGTLYLYYYDETNGLQLVANPDNAILTFDKNGTYVLSAKNLIPSTPSEEVPETPSEDVPEVPQTFDSLGMYAGFGIIGALGITGAVLYLKKRA